MINMVIMETAAMITRRRAKDNRNMNTIRVFSLSSLLIAAAALLLATSAHATIVDLTTSANASGDINGDLFFTIDQQAADTGVIDPLLLVQATPAAQV